MKYVAKKTLGNAFKLLCFVLVSCFALFLIGAWDILKVQDQTWLLIGLLTAVALIQYICVFIAVSVKNAGDGDVSSLTAVQWILTFIPGVVLLIGIILMFALGGNSADLLKLNIPDDLWSLLVVVVTVGICYLFDYAYIVSMRKYNVHKTTVKVVEKQKVKQVQNSPKANGGAGQSAGSGANNQIGENDTVFPDLVEIDKQYELVPYEPVASNPCSLEELCNGFNEYLEGQGMFYAKNVIRSFVAGLACSKFMILEGLSGTGKTSMPKFFSKYIGSDVCFTSVQASWKDRTDVLGYYNDFVAKFKETPFLRSLYTSSYKNDEVNLMVLDEMNLSRVEYYFADFLSVLELDKSQWKIELMPQSTQGIIPQKLQDCAVVIPDNVWFIGTANKDDSTFTITDKVYDRAFIIDFSHRIESKQFKQPTAPIHLGATRLNQLFDEALNNSQFTLSNSEYQKFSQLTKFVLDTFDINFGNRILNQIYKFVPVFVACGGTTAKALDIMFARKVLRKLDMRFDDTIKPNLVKLEKLILENYSQEEFSLTIEAIAKLKRKLI